MIDIEKNKEVFLAELDKVQRAGMHGEKDSVVSWLKKTDFFTAPASTKFHLSVKGGLCQHSLNVLHRLKEELFNEYGDKCPYTEESVIIVALLHDVCKANFYKESTRNVQDETTGKWDKVPCYLVDEKFHFCHGEKSQFLIERFMSTTIDEALAIRYHMGAYDAAFKGGDNSHTTVFKERPLAFLLHVADQKATNLDEKVGE